jgi:hypothetical protein
MKRFAENKMPTKAPEVMDRWNAMRFMAGVVALLLIGAYSGRAQSTRADIYGAWNAYNSTFLFAYSPGQRGFAQENGGTRSTGFWEDVEEIEVAEDAYDWAVKSDPTQDPEKYVTEINELCNGFAHHNKFANWPSNDWSVNRFNDDLNWAAIAFARAWKITGNLQWLNAAEISFATVWKRAQAGNGGLYQTVGGKNEDAPANFTFVIAGYLLYAASGNPSYKKAADSVFAWSKANLYVASGPLTGKIYDSTTGHSDYSYNYGIAIGAALDEGDGEMVKNVADWLMNRSNNPNLPYAGTYEGFNLLPDYHQGGRNNGGYNGIALRYVGMAAARGALTAKQVAWAEANVSRAWSLRNKKNVVWNKWNAPTPESGVYAWDCSSALAGMLDVPAP